MDFNVDDFQDFFRKIDVLGAEKLQHGKPAILIANHPASFLDAMVLAVFLGRPIHFYVRGDIFSHPIVYYILTKLHMIPIFSREHGTGNLSKTRQHLTGEENCFQQETCC